VPSKVHKRRGYIVRLGQHSLEFIPCRYRILRQNPLLLIRAASRSDATFDPACGGTPQPVESHDVAGDGRVVGHLGLHG